MALPKYPRIKARVEKMLLDRFNEKTREELGPFADSQRITQHEGRTLAHNTMDNVEELERLDYQEMAVEYRFVYDEVPNMTPEEVIAMIDEKAKDLGGQQAKHNYKVLNKVIEKTGNVVPAKGGPSVEMFLKSLETISINFDKDGNPKMPTLVIHPDQSEEWKKVIEEAKSPEVDTKVKEILKRKKAEFDAEQASRKLVD